jgi:hypothetical protein
LAGALLFRHFVPCCYSRVPRMSRVYGVEDLSLCILDGSWLRWLPSCVSLIRLFSWQTSTTKESSNSGTSTKTN